MLAEDILEWIATLPKWEQKLGCCILEKKQITESFLNEVYDDFKVEVGLEDGNIPESIILPSKEDPEKNPEVIWKGVGNLHGVNKLKTGPALSISEGLTIVYGENGSGKSGYTRLLNNAFISRGDQEILPNIYQDNPEDVFAEFEFTIDGKHEVLNYPERSMEYPFKTIRNFDSKSASDDMNKESTIDFVPSDLLFFDALLSACTEIQKRLDNERANKRTDNPVLKFFPNEGEASRQMGSLSAKSKIEDIQTMFAVSDDEKIKYEQIKTEKISLIALDIDKQIRIITQVIDALNKAIDRFEAFGLAVSNDNIKIYNQQIDFLKKTKLAHDTAGLSLFDGDDIEKLGSAEWKEFIVSAKKYFDGIKGHDTCPLCGHEVYADDLIFKYWKYLESDVENNLKVARNAIEISIKDIKELDLHFLLEDSVIRQWLQENFKSETENIDAIFKKCELIKNQIVNCLEHEKEVEEVIVQTPNIKGLIDAVTEKKNSLNQEVISNRIVECSKYENEYIDKTKVLELIPIIETYVEYLNWDAKAEKSKIKTRNITTKQKELFEKYVTDDYLKTFERECEKLKANFNIEIVSRGSNGQTLKKLQIKGNAPGKVLSEGEQRAISIANFLTEVHMDSRNVGIVLDDPVCSLDHKRRTYIVNRLLEEAQRRQVIVFTHEITFFMELKTEAERSSITFEQETIRKISNEPGDISKLIPWQGMNVRDRIGKLKNDLQGIVALFNSGDVDSYYYRAKEWCELLRESWERAVEEVLFNDAIQRYNPCVQTQRLKKAPFTQELYSELEQGMTECSAWCHDQARAINGDIPSVEDLRNYIDCFESYYKKYRA